MNFRLGRAGRGFAHLFLCLWTGILFAQGQSSDTDLIAHEWGTFTSIAGADGRAVEWTPLNLGDLSSDENGNFVASNHYHPKDLPSFVENLHFGVFKSGLPATIRMETPVLYFYVLREMTISVHVKFVKGMITEWYPHATAPIRYGGLDDATAYRKEAFNGAINWNAVRLQPGAAVNFPLDSADDGNRYYAARETSSVPLSVSAPGGAQQEKFLFYRGVSLATVPIVAKFVAGGKLLVTNSFAAPIPNVVWFERRGEHIGYRIGGAVNDKDQTTLEPPELTARVESLYGDLEEILVARGLFREEAHAMVQTWRDSWFDEGSRLLYIVPTAFVDSTLPLNITPAPTQTVRVFVGRLEVMSPTTQKAVAAAVVANDKTTLAKYGRFLEPILNSIHQQAADGQRPVGKTLSVPCSVDLPSNSRNR